MLLQAALNGSFTKAETEPLAEYGLTRGCRSVTLWLLAYVRLLISLLPSGTADNWLTYGSIVKIFCHLYRQVGTGRHRN